MNNALKRIRKVSRQLAVEQGLVYYDNGVPCLANHEPIIRIASTGGCYHCKKERDEKRLEKKRWKSEVRYYLRFKRKDGTFEIIGPFKRQATAVVQYKRRYLAEYGVPCPAHYFSGVESED